MKTLIPIFVLLIILMGAYSEVSALDYTLDLGMSLGEQYNDNIFLDHSNKTSDYISLITPSIALSTRTERIEGMISYTPTFNFFLHESDNDSITHSASARGLYKMSDDATFTLSDSFVMSRESYVLRTIENAGPITNGRDKIVTNALNAALLYKVSGKITLIPSASYSVTNDLNNDLIHSNTYAGGLGATYLLNERTTLRTNFTYDIAKYRGSHEVSGEAISVGASYRMTPTLIIDAYGGEDFTHSEGSLTSESFIGGLSISKTFGRSSISLMGREAVISGLESSTHLRSRYLSVAYALRITDALIVSLSPFYDRYTSIGSNLSTGAQTNRTDIGGNASISYTINQWLIVDLAYYYIKSDDKITASGSYNNNLITVALRIAKQAKF